jgi:metal-responsive CopG/Arc/MetJ family transcriptional regulator
MKEKIKELLKELEEQIKNINFYNRDEIIKKIVEILKEIIEEKKGGAK